MAPRPTDATATLLELREWPTIGVGRLRDVAIASAATCASPLQVARARFPGAAAAAERARAVLSESVQRLLQACANDDIAVLSLLDDAYPARLRVIDDAPPLLFVRGSVDALARPAIAVVGTREASGPGRAAARAIARFLAEHGVAVVSGLALGIDAAAHEGALESSGITVAALAHGLHTVTPAANRALAERLLRSGGALVSEHPPGVPPRPAEFARRNRIQSGLSLASIIVESGTEGGAMIQANFTRQQRRPLLAVLSGKAGFNGAGAQRLIKDFGARPLEGTAQLGARLPGILQGLLPPEGVQAALVW